MKKKVIRTFIIFVLLCAGILIAGMWGGPPYRLFSFANKYIGAPANKKIIDNNVQQIENTQSGVQKIENTQAYVKNDKTASSNRYSLENTTFVNSQGKHEIIDPEDLLVMVNKSRNLPSSWAPKDLVVPNVSFTSKQDSPVKYMRKTAAKALEDLFNQAKKDKINILAVSGYRPYEMQKRIFNNNAKLYGEKVANQTSAYPGQSEHQTGLAMDVSSSSVKYQLEQSFGNTAEGKWLRENAAKFGFIIRYPKGKENITKYSYEPWHIRYIGKDIAESIESKDITLEEFFNALD